MSVNENMFGYRTNLWTIFMVSLPLLPDAKKHENHDLSIGRSLSDDPYSFIGHVLFFFNRVIASRSDWLVPDTPVSR